MAKRRNISQKQKRLEQQAADQQAQRMQLIRYSALGILVILILAGIGYVRTPDNPEPEAEIPAEIMAANIAGPADAPVEIVEFGDFGCPTCRAWHNTGIKEQLLDEFGDQINFTFRHFPIITPLSPKAAEAGQCAAEQDAFWDYHDYIYEQTLVAALERDNLVAYAAELGLNSAEFETCLDSGKYEAYVERDWDAAVAAGASGTPSFFINGEPVGRTYEAMAGTIRSILES